MPVNRRREVGRVFTVIVEKTIPVKEAVSITT